MARLLPLLGLLALAACSVAPATSEPAATTPGATACAVDADCAVKNVGNCCGYFPACVHVDAPTDPEAVEARCEQEGRMSTCGFREITACRCNAGTCEAADENALR